jgi:deoxycytidylate deaminase
MAIVGRKVESGNALLTKPCPECEKRIIAAGIAQVYHTFYDPTCPKDLRFETLVPKLINP